MVIWIRTTRGACQDQRPLSPTSELENRSLWGWDVGMCLFNKYPGGFQWSQSLKNSVLNKGAKLMPTDGMPSLGISGQDARDGLPPGSSADSNLRDTPLPRVTDSRSEVTLPLLTEGSLVPRVGPPCWCSAVTRASSAMQVYWVIPHCCDIQLSRLPQSPPARTRERGHLVPCT